MKNICFLLFLAAGTFFFACQNESKTTTGTEGPEVELKEGEELLETRVTRSVATIYEMDLANSYVTWKATKKIGGGHTGQIKASMGRLAYDDNRIVAGDIEMDMSTLTVLDEMDPDSKAKLTRHLKSDDFFNAEKYPSAKFQFQRIQTEDDLSGGYNYTITGPLTMRGITKMISVPANVDVQSDKIEVTTPPFEINRTQWAINYNSAILGTLADNIINDQVVLTINAVFVPR